jgi:hypothetical protein
VRGIAEVRIRIYTNDREQPIDLTVREIHPKMTDMRTNEGEHPRERSVDQTVRGIIKDSDARAEPNILFKTDSGTEGAIYLNTEKVAAVVTSWVVNPDQAEQS